MFHIDISRIKVLVETPWGLIYCLDFSIGAYSRRLNIFLLVCHIPFEIVVAVSYFLILKNTSNRVFFKGHRILH